MKKRSEKSASERKKRHLHGKGDLKGQGQGDRGTDRGIHLFYGRTASFVECGGAVSLYAGTGNRAGKIVQKIGIRTVEIVDRKLLINGTSVKLKGVNRHDSNPYHGAAVTKEDALTDLRLMKEHNVNAIRRVIIRMHRGFPNFATSMDFI